MRSPSLRDGVGLIVLDGGSPEATASGSSGGSALPAAAGGMARLLDKYARTGRSHESAPYTSAAYTCMHSSTVDSVPGMLSNSILDSIPSTVLSTSDHTTP